MVEGMEREVVAEGVLVEVMQVRAELAEEEAAVVEAELVMVVEVRPAADMELAREQGVV